MGEVHISKCDSLGMVAKKMLDIVSRTALEEDYQERKTELDRLQQSL